MNAVNINKRLGLFGLLGILQDAAGLHAIKLGFGYEDMIKTQTFWVIIRQRIMMKSWPNWNDEIDIKTWSRPLEGMIAIRDYEIYHQEEIIGECSTSWMVMDGGTRKATKLDLLDRKVNVRTDYQLSFTAEKIELRGKGEKVGEVQVKISDLDMNNHVNNTKYSQWVLDCIPLESHREKFLKDFQINFLNECQLGDQIEIFSFKDEVGVQFYGQRKSDRKTAFITELKVD